MTENKIKHSANEGVYDIATSVIGLSWAGVLYSAFAAASDENYYSELAVALFFSVLFILSLVLWIVKFVSVRRTNETRFSFSQNGPTFAADILWKMSVSAGISFVMFAVGPDFFAPEPVMRDPAQLSLVKLALAMALVFVPAVLGFFLFSMDSKLERSEWQSTET